MKDTGLYSLDRPVPNLAMGYVATEWYEDASPEAGGPYRNNLLRQRAKGGAAGGAFSTAPDLLRFAEALTDGRLLSEESWEEMRQPRVDGKGQQIGYGLISNESPNTFGHNGGAPGIGAVLKVFEDSGHTLVILSNLGSMLPVDMTLTAMIHRQ
jgi:CubicO group peptidase (beta-lactamase class C family)